MSVSPPPASVALAGEKLFLTAKYWLSDREPVREGIADVAAEITASTGAVMFCQDTASCSETTELDMVSLPLLLLLELELVLNMAMPEGKAAPEGVLKSEKNPALRSLLPVLHVRGGKDKTGSEGRRGTGWGGGEEESRRGVRKQRGCHVLQ